MKRRFSDNSGSALVEVALAAPIFLLMVTGAFELGRVAHFAIEVQNAARAGASFGSEPGNATSTGITQAAANDAPDLGSLTVTPGTACICETLTTGNTPTYSPSSGTIACTDPTIVACTGSSSTVTNRVVSYVTVSTQATINPVFTVKALPGSYTLHGYSEMRVLPN
ncbi:MAG TPA: TadE/TadG family type IV pilus assembly protein [Terracidiphilus sp.]|nr:TadE/TadG family type IV pilus assembly protein [Terracidiphilus sp.]